MSRKLSSLLRLYKSYKCSMNKQKRPYSKKVETTYSSQFWNIKEGSSICSPGGTNLHVCSTQRPDREKGGFSGSPCQKGLVSLPTVCSKSKVQTYNNPTRLLLYS